MLPLKKTRVDFVVRILHNEASFNPILQNANLQKAKCEGEETWRGSCDWEPGYDLLQSHDADWDYNTTSHHHQQQQLCPDIR